jgi:hypothetical protein
MEDALLLTLTLNGVAENSVEEKRAADAVIAALVADLNAIESVRAAHAFGEELEPGSKSAGRFLLGVLKAQMNGENALKVMRHLFTSLKEASAPFEVEIRSAGEETRVTLKGPVRDPAEMAALLSQAEQVVHRLRRD